MEYIHLFQPPGVPYQSSGNIHKNLMTRKSKKHLLGALSSACKILEGFEKLACSISFRGLVLTKTKGWRKLRGLDFSISCSLVLKIHSALNSTNGRGERKWAKF